MWKRMEMKKEYFIEQNGKKEGAFTLNELKQRDIYDDALVWKAGWDGWKNVLSVEELSGFVIILPPPTPEEKVKKIKKEKLNNTISNTPLKLLKIVGVILITLTLTAFFGAMSNMSGGVTLGIWGYFIFGIWGFGIYLIIKIVRR